MKKRLMALFVVAMILTMIPSTLAFADETVAPVPDAPDYSKAECWYQIPEITKDVDTIYVYQTEYKTTNEGDPDYAPLNNPEMQEGVKNIDHKNQASVFEDATNLFIPYYRQCSFKNAVDAWKNTGDVRTALTGLPYDDITAALNYYFESCNGGRPFILAGHSQGSAILTLVLEKYFKEHPEYYDRMVAAYVIGFSVTKDELEANPHLKFAAGESDTGVIVSWDVEGPENVEQNAPAIVHLPNAISINPLNWKLDETYAPASMNLGSLVPNEETGEYEIRNIGADAQVNTARGTVVTNAQYDNTSNAEFFGPQSFHEDDYQIYYNNIKDNVAKRIVAYKNKKDAQTQPTTQPTTKAEEPTTEEELINGGQIFTGFEQTLYDPDTGAAITLKELSQGGWANEGTGVIYTQEGGGGDHYYGNDGSVLITEWLYYHSGEEGSVDDTEDSVEEDSAEEDDSIDDGIEDDNEENDW